MKQYARKERSVIMTGVVAQKKTHMASRYFTPRGQLDTITATFAQCTSHLYGPTSVPHTCNERPSKKRIRNAQAGYPTNMRNDAITMRLVSNKRFTNLSNF